MIVDLSDRYASFLYALPVTVDWRTILPPTTGLRSQIKISQGRYDQSYWLYLPSWIFSHANKRAGRHAQLQHDISWGQYCLFAAIQMQDDVFDGQSKQPSGIYLGDFFLLEAQEVFRRHFESRSRFWKEMNDCLRRTLAGILQVRKLQSSKTIQPAKLARAYVDVAAIFEVGSIASAIACHHEKLLPSLLAYCRAMSVAGQLVDDYQDMLEDFEQGCWNYALQLIMKDVSLEKLRSADSIAPLLERYDHSIVFDTMKRCVQRARRATRASPIGDIDAYLDHYARAIENMRSRYRNNSSQYTSPQQVPAMWK